jgi:hypothetical protein
MCDPSVHPLQPGGTVLMILLLLAESFLVLWDMLRMVGLAEEHWILLGTRST